MTYRTVYAVTKGSYSDYHVVALFENEADANEAAALENRDRSAYQYAAEIEPFALYTEVPTPTTEYVMTAHFWDSRDDSCDDGPRIRTGLHLGNPVPVRPEVTLRKILGGHALMVRGRSASSVKQAFSDNRARILACREGIT